MAQMNVHNKKLQLNQNKKSKTPNEYDLLRTLSYPTLIFVLNSRFSIGFAELYDFLIIWQAIVYWKEQIKASLSRK